LTSSLRANIFCSLKSRLSEKSKVKRLSSIALLIFMIALALPCYSQQVETSAKTQATDSTSEQSSDSLKQAKAKLSGEVESSRELESSQTSANQTANQTTKQKADQAYVFPTRRERFNRYVKSTIGPFSLLNTAVSAGIKQWKDNPEEWEQGASGYGKRYASSFGRNAIQQTVIYGLDSSLGLDTGFKKSTRKGFWPRMKDALAENITSRTRTGKRVISVPRISGIYASRIIRAETWYPPRYDYKDGLRSGTRSLVTGFGMNLVREFVINF
jgi:hypothetical protein